MAPWILEIGAVAVAAAVWFGLYALMLLVTRPADVTAAPATQDLADEPPAVASLIASRWAFTEDAAESTLLDLAARKFFEFRQPADDPRHTTIHLRPAGGPDPSTLTAYERRVLDRVRGLAVNGVVPLTALTFRDHGRSAAWWKALRAEVVADARARGLSRRRLSAPFLSVLGFVAAGVGVVATLMTLHYMARSGTLGDDFLSALFGGFVAFFILVGIAQRDIGERDTAAGRAAAARWLGVRSWLRAHESFAELPPSAVAVWDRYLPYGAALGTTRVSSAVIDMGMGNRSLIWSSFGGTWHRVRVKYPSGERYGKAAGPIVGKVLLRLLIGVVFVRIFGGSLVRDFTNDIDQLNPFESWINLFLPVMFGIGIAALSSAAYLLVRLVIDLASPVTLTGEVLWIQTATWSSASENSAAQPILDYLAIDDGTSDVTRAWLMPSGLNHQCDTGDTATITAYRWSRRVKTITRDKRGSTPPPSDHVQTVTDPPAHKGASPEAVRPSLTLLEP